MLYGSYYVSHGDKDSSQASDWSGLGAADSCEEKHTWAWIIENLFQDIGIKAAEGY